MVNVLKRMRNLQPLFKIRHGEGAAILPPPPSPQLTRLSLQYDRKQWNKSTRPARIFQKDHLPRLKYHNPALPIRVEQGPSRLQLTFESADQHALREMERTSLERSNDGEYRETWTEIEAKSQPVEETTASTSSSLASPATSIFTRSVELRLGPHQPGSIWKWFQNTTKCEDFPENPEENEQMERLNEFFVKAEEDRQRVKAGMDAIRKQKEDLKRAREAAERMANEA
ncbi:uncharacterized protein Z519_03406 [Cladophialophora bantiana CBS 173.52]|uniref:Ribosomal protein/NADH dehydrogenase domain-containing protein n=1 Tax=Cladophialophora bantiana (strain ATCC 10958 / CBS 173.52 / CDC B-1940 / NIH 8579) TaxID=1442370 RepID=A0A0D2GD39_CLAB1|nr:uncharacterized protein Z519_03406 [Cladophialophora bantiana CBS 173.52]KIW96337.1 hypothetical protein Z519_03406 [Cladophialophora bantiana CBS 173.52]